MKILLPLAALALATPLAALAAARNYAEDQKWAPPANPDLPSLFVVGDAIAGRMTALDMKNEIKRNLGWAVSLATYFDPEKINVVNRGQGASTRMYLTLGYWDKVLPEIKRGDIVLLAFGQFEGNPVEDPRHGPGPLPGLGQEARVIGALRPETVHTYGWYLRKYIADVRAAGAVPVVLAPCVWDLWKDGKVQRGPAGAEGWAAAVAHEQHAAFVDVSDLAGDRYDSLGEQKVAAFYTSDRAVTSVAGAKFNAAIILSGLKGLGNPSFAPYLSARGRAIPAADASLFADNR